MLHRYSSLIDQFAGQLHKLGLGPGDRIAVFLPPSEPLIALFFAIWKIGASICPLNLRLPPAEIKSCVKRLQAKLFIDSLPIQGPVLSAISVPIPPSAFFFTSGSTGTPKIAVLSEESLLANASASVPLASAHKWLLSLPLFHVGGLGIALRCHLAGAEIAFNPADPAITHISCVPTHLYRAHPVYKNLACVLLGGAPIASYPENLPIYLTYGLTEMGSMVAARPKPPKIGGAYYLGMPLPGREVRIGENGEIFVRGKTRFLGYWNGSGIDPAPEWFPTGDIGRLDPVEGLAILGRKDWMFISGGENIQPEEIEQHLLSHPAIVEACVVPKKDPEFGMRPAAFAISNDPHLNLHRLAMFLAEKLPKFKIPVSLILRDELPKTGIKINRQKLFEEANRE